MIQRKSFSHENGQAERLERIWWFYLKHVLDYLPWAKQHTRNVDLAVI